jgi:hypothetical protein
VKLLNSDNSRVIPYEIFYSIFMCFVMCLCPVHVRSKKLVEVIIRSCWDFFDVVDKHDVT